MSLSAMFYIGMISTGILISLMVVFFYCALIVAARADEHEAGIQPENETRSVAPERRSLRVVRQEDQTWGRS